MAKVIMTDSIRNKAVGVFDSTTEALKYAKQEGIQVVSFETFKGGETHERKEMDRSGS
ncbi:hypothetical protein [Trichococcus flocculiformis]|uniref:hypothetical protein n=1 Tax=Trichococcus flocculiformis TaxID=82803 RepID=UPI003DA4C7B9